MPFATAPGGGIHTRRGSTVAPSLRRATVPRKASKCNPAVGEGNLNGVDETSAGFGATGARTDGVALSSRARASPAVAGARSVFYAIALKDCQHFQPAFRAHALHEGAHSKIVHK